jgi:hypothetical protein
LLAADTIPIEKVSTNTHGARSIISFDMLKILQKQEEKKTEKESWL